MFGPPLQRHPMAPLSFLLMVTLLFQVATATVRSRAAAGTTSTTLSPEAELEFIKAVNEIFTPPYEESTPSSQSHQNVDPVEPIPDDIMSSSSESSRPPKPDGCQCVAYYLCVNDTIVTNGDGLIDIRIQEDNPCKETFEKCCKELKDQPVVESKLPESNDENAIPKCGQWNPGGVGFRIVGSGNEAQFGEFPWMVAILKKDEDNNNNLCGGSLIHPKVVLTAIHYIHDKKPNQLLVRAGEWDTRTENEHFKHQERQVTKIIKHDKYYGGALFNDIALIVVNKEFILKDNVGTICLPPQSYIFPSNQRCYASGWGKDTFGKGGTYQNILKKIDMPIVQRDECVELLRRTRLGQHYHLHESFICAGGEIGKDTCQGDGGSPMACPVEGNPQQLQQAGIVAWGIGCGDATPGVYVDVARFRLWIDHQILHLDLSPFYYDATYDKTKQNPYKSHSSKFK